MSATPSTPGSDEGLPHSTPPPTAAAPETTTTGIDHKVAGLLTYLVGWISGLIFYLVEKEHREVRFHAAQSILVSIGLIGLYIVLSILQMIPVLGLLFFAVAIGVGLASLALWIYLMIQGYNLNHVRLPVVGKMAEQWAAK